MIDFSNFIKSLSKSNIEIDFGDSEGRQKVTHEIGNIKVEFIVSYSSEIAHHEPATYFTPSYTKLDYSVESHDDIFLYWKGREMDLTEEEHEEIDNTLYKLLY